MCEAVMTGRNGNVKAKSTMRAVSPLYIHEQSRLLAEIITMARQEF
jgi:hypothetical protein